MEKVSTLKRGVGMLASASILALLLMAAQAAQSEAAPTTKASATAIKAKVKPSYDPKVVPRGKTYRLMDGNKLIKEFPAGTTTTMKTTATMDCWVVNCPPQFPDDVVCWECKERPADTEKKKAKQ